MFWRNLLLVSKGLNQHISRAQTRTFLTTSFLRKNHYEALGVKKDATQAEIKNAYFELSKLYHPDRITATDENLAKFREISDAYEVLGNEQSRKLYDTGLLGETKKIGIDDAEEVKSTIIEFYKQKHQTGIKKETAGSEWTQELYKAARKSALNKNDLYQGNPRKAYDPDKDKYYHSMIFILLMVLCCYLWCFREPNIIKERFRFIYDYFNLEDDS